MEEVLAVLHEIHLFEEEVCLLSAEALLAEDCGGRLLELVVGPFDFFDVDLLFVVHFAEPVVHDLLLLRHHRTERVEEVASPHDLRIHDDLINQVVCVSDQLAVSTCSTSCSTLRLSCFV